jgi:hypothetical protein
MIGGIISLFGLGYLGYNYLFSSNPSADGSITPTVNNPGNTSSSSSIFSYITNNLKRLNPYYWFLTDPSNNNQAAYNVFIENQKNASTHDRRFYPFTSADPFKPWYSRLRILMFGESGIEIDQRMHDKTVAWRSIMPITLGGNNPLSVATSGSITPSLATVGLGTNIPSGSQFLGNIEASTSYQNVMEKFNTVPSTPTKITPSYLPPLSSDVLRTVGGNSSDWINPTSTSQANITIPTQASATITDNLPVVENKQV